MSGYFNTATYFASPYFGSSGAVATTGGGGGGWNRLRGPRFGSYVDEIRRAQLADERKVTPPKPKWIRHHDD